MQSAVQGSATARKNGQGNIPDGHDQSIRLDFGTRNDIPSQSDSIPILHLSPAVFQLIILRLVHEGGCGEINEDQIR